jgi:iron(III) transport system substrate-binding protein
MDWDNLLQPKWKGKISIDQEEYKWYAAMLAAWGKEKAHKFMTALAKQGIQWRKDHALIVQLMAAGEFPLSIAYAHRIEDMKNQGAPVEWVQTVDPIAASIQRARRQAQSPGDRETLYRFYSFKRRTRGDTRASLISARSDVDPPSPKMIQSTLKMKAVPQDFELRVNDHAQAFKKIFGL